MISRAIIATVHPGWALAWSLAVAPQPGPASPPPQDLLTELAAKVAAIVDPAAPPPAISINCSSNLRERVCTAEIRTGTAREVVIATRPHQEATAEAIPAVPVVIQLRPIIAQADAILDAVMMDQRLLVLDAFAVTLYDANAGAWRRLRSYQIQGMGPRPRDLRGRLRVTGGIWEAFLPGGSCRGPLEPLTGSCTRQQQPWPLGIDNTGLTPGRNVFESTGGQKYFGVAPLDADAGARWLLATEDTRLVFLDEQRTPIDAPAGVASDVAAVSTACARGSHVVVADVPPDRAVDTLRIVRVLGRRLADAAPPVALPGRLTALWTTAAGDGAVAVARNPTTRGYEAFQIALACGR